MGHALQQLGAEGDLMPLASSPLPPSLPPRGVAVTSGELAADREGQA